MTAKSDTVINAPAAPDGGLQYLSWNLGPGVDVLSDKEQAILAALGAAVVREWNNFPKDVQKQIFNRATRADAQDKITPLTTMIAQFLHHHKAPHT